MPVWHFGVTATRTQMATHTFDIITATPHSGLVHKQQVSGSHNSPTTEPNTQPLPTGREVNEHRYLIWSPEVEVHRPASSTAGPRTTILSTPSSPFRSTNKYSPFDRLDDVQQTSVKNLTPVDKIMAMELPPSRRNIPLNQVGRCSSIETVLSVASHEREPGQMQKADPWTSTSCREQRTGQRHPWDP